MKTGLWSIKYLLPEIYHGCDVEYVDEVENRVYFIFSEMEMQAKVNIDTQVVEFLFKRPETEDWYSHIEMTFEELDNANEAPINWRF